MCRPISRSAPSANLAARVESSMKTIALTDEIRPARKHARAASVAVFHPPQSSALTISIERSIAQFAFCGRPWLLEHKYPVVQELRKLQYDLFHAMGGVEPVSWCAI